MEPHMPPRAPQKPRTPVALPIDDDALIRLPDVLAVFPIGPTSWFKGIAEGRYPKPLRLSARTVAWRVSDIRRLLASVGDEHPGR